MNNQFSGRPDIPNNDFNYRKYLIILLSKWYWLLLTFLIAMGVAYLINNSAPKKYKLGALISFKEDSDQRRSRIDDALENMDLLQGIRPPGRENEIQFLQSYELIKKTIEKLDFEISYFKEGRLYDQELYKSTPFHAVVEDTSALYNHPVHIELISSKKYKVIIDRDYYAEYTLRFGEKFSKHDLNFKLVKNKNYKGTISQGDRFYFTAHRMDNLVKTYQGKLEVAPIEEESNILQLSLVGQIPEKESDFLTTLIETYEKRQLARIDQNAEISIEFINNQMDMIDNRLVKYENELQRLKEENRNLGQRSFESNNNQNQATSSSANNELERLEDEKLRLQENKEYFTSLAKKIEANRSMDSIFFPRTFEEETPRISQRLNELASTQQELNALSDNVESSHPRYKTLQSSVKEQKQSLLKRVNAYIDHLDKEIGEVNDQIADIESQIPSYPLRERRYREAQRKIEQNENILSALSERKLEFELMKASKTPTFEVMERPRPSNAQLVSSNAKLNYLFAFFIGLVLPAAFFILRKSTYSKIEEKEEITNNTAIPILHALNHNPHNTDLPVHYYPQSPIADSFRYIRTNLLFRLKSYHNKIIAVSSMVGGEGKSFITANLGAILAMGGFKTIIISADIRRPTLQKIFSINNKQGVSEYLVNNFNHENLIHSTLVDNLYLMPPGKNISNSGDLFSGNKIETLLDYLSTQFEFILFDSPPISMVPESIIIGERSYCNIFVLRHNYTPKSVLDFVNEINQEGRLKNMFLLVNDIKKMKGIGFEYHYGYNSSYGFGYDKKYYNNKNKNKVLPEHAKLKYYNKS
ncbi:MAG: polysaccharide biosynthesis tyrosine autokinase [Bacteroidales bacterium]